MHIGVRLKAQHAKVKSSEKNGASIPDTLMDNAGQQGAGGRWSTPPGPDVAPTLLIGRTPIGWPRQKRATPGTAEV